jgi:hypothetical protein
MAEQHDFFESVSQFPMLGGGGIVSLEATGGSVTSHNTAHA